MILGFPASCRRSALPYQSRLQNSDIAKLCDFMLRTFPVGVRQRNSETAVKHTSATTFQCTCLSNPIAVYIVVSKVHDHHHHHHHHHGFVIIIMIIMITSVNSCGMGKYHQLIFFLFITDQISNTPYDKYVECCNHINLSSKEINNPPPPLTNALYGVITPTHLQKGSTNPPPPPTNMLDGVITPTHLRKGSKIHHPLRQTC